ncbi:hypothetical protein GNI_160200 [Gregarina niphandrodes]|uniref:Uncharacterized protein n=1 Tax=Gregarina niphandrodes TaxID=110365 RepID=A0A023AZM4_GRENI|nr:hypothetical protein GNI_160200 [Gregarina niphandrodes]EZG43755.1 hypothetical protein GNI_160200 [Gregarina niphandrodes]|eukprot:XP_011134626.1 hypothetical protein GNI_160200 [Gregarina niphandrodes]
MFPNVLTLWQEKSEDPVLPIRTLPFRTMVYCETLRNECDFLCQICQDILTPTMHQGEWTLQDVVVCQLAENSDELALMSSTTTSITGGSGELDYIVAGPAKSEFRRQIGSSYTAARKRTKDSVFPEKLKGFFARLIKAVDRDTDCLQAIASTFEQEGTEPFRLLSQYVKRAINVIQQEDQGQVSDEDDTPMREEEPIFQTLLTVALSPNDALAVRNKFGRNYFLCHTSCAAVQLSCAASQMSCTEPQLVNPFSASNNSSSV